METGVRLESIWRDNDVVEVRISAWNGQFGGVADAYVEIGGVNAAATKLEGFPRHATDSCGLEFGAFGPGFAGGGVSLHFYSRGFAGHTFAEVTIESGYDQFEQTQRTTLRASVEVAAIDRFVAELRNMEQQIHPIAFLKFNVI